jgi:hypothetical protein
MRDKLKKNLEWESKSQNFKLGNLKQWVLKPVTMAVTSTLQWGTMKQKSETFTLKRTHKFTWA